LEESISGNPEDISPQVLHSRALEIINPIFEREIRDHLASYGELLGSDRTSSDIEEVVKAAFHGRVDVLFVSRGEENWGHFDPATDEMQLVQTDEPGAIELLDFAAAQTLLNSGTEYALQPEVMPRDSTIAALSDTDRQIVFESPFEIEVLLTERNQVKPNVGSTWFFYGI
jgi:hypothetical protein